MAALPEAFGSRSTGASKKKPPRDRRPKVPALRRVWFGSPPAEKKPKPPPKARVRVKNDPQLIAAARELRDRWLEKVNAPGGAGLLEAGPGGRAGKYDVGARALLPAA